MSSEWNSQLVKAARYTMGVWGRLWNTTRHDYRRADDAAEYLRLAIVWREKSEHWKHHTI